MQQVKLLKLRGRIQSKMRGSKGFKQNYQLSNQRKKLNYSKSMLRNVRSCLRKSKIIAEISCFKGSSSKLRLKSDESS